MPTAFEIDVAATGRVTGLYYPATTPASLNAALILAHGAGAGQQSPFMVACANGLSARGVDTVTFNFVYMERGRRAPDPRKTLESCYCAAITIVRTLVPSARSKLFVGGKSMGGRIASQVVAADDHDLGVAGLVFLGYPLHPPGRPEKRRDAHLSSIGAPMLFVQGARDPFGTETEVRLLVDTLPSARLSVVTGGDHSLTQRGRGAPSREETLADVHETVATWIGGPDVTQRAIRPIP